MMDLNLSEKERLVLNELIHKYQFNKVKNREDLLALHQQLVGRLTKNWIRDYIQKKQDQAITFYERYALLIYPLAHPALRIKDNQLEEVNSFYWSNRIRSHFSRIINCSASVGRIIIKNKNGRLIPQATGFRVLENLLVRVDQSSTGRRETFWDKINQNPCWVDFSGQKRIPDPSHLFEVQNQPEGVLKLAEGLNAISLKSHNDLGKPLPPPLDVAEELPPYGFVIAMGYPLKMQRLATDDLLQYAVFGSPWQMNRKHLSLGQLRVEDSMLMKHDCCMAIGSEGAPLIDPANGKIVGIHLGMDSQDCKIGWSLSLKAIKRMFKLILKESSR